MFTIRKVTPQLKRQMNNVINSPSKESAIADCARFKAYFPYRYAGIVDLHGNWGYATGKTMAKFNSLSRAGFPVFMVSK